jgi:hypothetical protein
MYQIMSCWDRIKAIGCESFTHAGVAFGVVTVAGTIATNGRSLWLPIVGAWLASILVIVPSVVLRNLILHKGIRHLAAIAWRMPMAMAMVLLAALFEDEQRNCYLWALVTCYFITLTLESWLQIRQANIIQNSNL